MVRVRNAIFVVPIIIALSIFLYNFNFSFAQSDFDGLQQSTNPFKYDGFNIERIEVIGNNVLSDDEVISDFGIDKGTQFNSRAINNAIVDMFSNSKYERAAIDIEQVGDNSIVLKIIVSEQPVISSIYFNGNKKISSGSLKTEIEPYLKEGGTYSPQALNEAANTIISNYQDKGYLKVYVSPKVSENKDDSSIEIDFDIEEAQEIHLDKINFFGNTKYNSNTLRNQMETKIRGLFSFGKFDELKFASDLNAVTVYYRDRGYYYADIADVRYRYEWKDPNVKDIQNLIIDVYIDEGEQYDFGDVDIKGNVIMSREDLFRQVNARKGQLYNYSTFYTDYSKLQALYSEMGYIFRQVIPIVKVDEENKTVNITYDIIENDKAHIEGISISGNTKTKDFVIERYIDIKPGEIFNSQKIQRMQEQLFNTQYFNNVFIDAKPGEVEGLMNIRLEVEEGKTAAVSGGLGYSTSSGFSGFASLEENNFLGRGLQLKVNGEVGEDLKSVGVSFVEPRLFNLPFYFGSSITYFYEDVDTGVAIGTDEYGFTKYSEYVSHGVDFLFRLGTYFARYYTTYLTFETIIQQYSQYANQGANINGAMNVPNSIDRELTKFIYKDGEFEKVESSWNTTFILSYSLLRDTRNNSLNPTSGWYGSYNVDLFFGFTEASRQTLKGFLAVPLFLGTSLALYGEFGQMLNGVTGNMKNDDSILYSLNPFEDIRGWNNDLYTSFKLNRGLSVYTFADGYLSSYGRTEVRFFFEYRIPIVKDIVGLVGFIDIGQLWLPYPSVTTANGRNTYTYASEFIDINALFDPSQYIYSVGFGVRLTVPIFNVRLYAAKRFVYNKGVGFQDFEEDDYTFLGEWFGRGWELVFSMNHEFY